jgi:hypothetical protein
MKTFKTRILNKAKESMIKAFGMGMSSGYLSIKAGINLYNALVSILDYGSEIWGYDSWEDGEKIQRTFGKRLLRCSPKTTNEAVLGELGWWRLSTVRDFKKICFWLKIQLMKPTRLVKLVYEQSKKSYLEKKQMNWTQGIHKLLIKYDLVKLWDNPENLTNLDELKDWEDKTNEGHLRFWKNTVKKQVHIKEEKEWKVVLTTSPKLRTYNKIKDKLELEYYLTNSDNVKGTQFLTSLRTGTNVLSIETGRWKGTSVDERKCKICLSDCVEDEEHFLMKCHAYQDLRMRFFETICTITKGKMNPFYQKDSFHQILKCKELNKDIIEETKFFIRKAMKRRGRLVGN